MRSQGEVLLLSCYELGHQPLHLAALQTLLKQAGYLPGSSHFINNLTPPENAKIRAYLNFDLVCITFHAL